MVPLSNPTTPPGDDEDQMNDDVFCRCQKPAYTSYSHLTPNPSDPSYSFPSYSATATITSTSNLPKQSTSGFNNNSNAIVGPHSSPKKISYDNFTPYLVSVRPSGRKRTSKTTIVQSNTPTSFSDSSVTILPPLNIHQQQLHHPSYRKSARKTSGRHHTVPVIIASSSNKLNSGNSIGKRALSAANAYDDDNVAGSSSLSAAFFNETFNNNNGSGRRHRSSAERKHKSSNPDKLSRRSQINKIETVRILRARPAFYPVKDKFSARGLKTSIVNEPLSPIQSSGTDIVSLDGLPHNILGKHITLMMDRSVMKRKRKNPATVSRPFEEV
jgi:hypothetical protein